MPRVRSRSCASTSSRTPRADPRSDPGGGGGTYCDADRAARRRANDICLHGTGRRGPPTTCRGCSTSWSVPSPPTSVTISAVAAGVNSALGMNPEYVDVISIDEHEPAARYKPDVFDDAGGEPGDAPLRQIVAEPIDTPVGARPGMLVHLRRPPSFEVLSYLLRSPPELRLARAACRDISVPFVIGGDVFDRTGPSHDLLRLPLGEQFDGFMAAFDPQHATETDAVLEVAERGVVLARYPLDLFALEQGARRCPSACIWTRCACRPTHRDRRCVATNFRSAPPSSKRYAVSSATSSSWLPQSPPPSAVVRSRSHCSPRSSRSAPPAG